MYTSLKARLNRARTDVRLWSEHLESKWKQVEQIAESMSIGRDVLIPIRYQEVEESPGTQCGYTTLLGLKEHDGAWKICLGRGPDELPFWQCAWKWTPRAHWTRQMADEAASHIDHFVEVLTCAAEIIAEEVEQAAAQVASAIHRLR